MVARIPVRFGLGRTRGRSPALLLGLALSLIGLGGCGEGSKNTDTTNPSPISDLAVADVGDSSVTLTWTAPGDDGMDGAAGSYDLRYLDTPLTDQDWVSSTAVSGLPVPSAPGTRDRVTIRGLPLDRLLYFGLVTHDDSGNTSLLSNVVSARPGPPLCLVTRDSLTFGSVFIGSEFDLTVTVSNEGGGTLRGLASLDCVPFSLQTGGGDFTLVAGQSREITIRFTPSSEAESSCLLDLGLSCTGVSLTGRGVPAVPPVMIPIPLGNFTMGSPPGEPGRSEDEPAHSVTLTYPYEIAEAEVTQAEWLMVMGWLDGESGADRPVTHITWFDAVEFCNRLSARDGYSRPYSLAEIQREGNHITRAEVVWLPDSSGYRLPTEAEWEFACRAGTKTAFFSGEIQELTCLPLDESLDPSGWYCGNSSGSSKAIRIKAANPWGLHDVHGNAFEWCYDWYGPYDTTGTEPILNPSGPRQGESRVIRGGSFDVDPPSCRSAFRLYHRPGSVNADTGLRLARNAS